MTYQNTTGCLSQGAHPGSYNGQDAYNDMLVTDESFKHGQWTAAQHEHGRPGEPAGLYARSASGHNMGGCKGGMTEPTYMSGRKWHNSVTEDGTATTLTAEEKDRPMAAQSVVRRLTPLECERLQGMPDDWSKYGVNEKGEVYELPDSALYKLQGNGIATPFWKWLLKRISAQYERTPTLGSLFDGQASFPMLWEGINGKGTALWSSEIEKHAIAVAKYHFPDDAEREEEENGRTA